MCSCSRSQRVPTRVKLTVLETASHQREVWHFADADWDRLVSNIEDTDWEFLSSSTPSEGAKRMTETLLKLAEDNIPRRTAAIQKSTHPWLTERGEEAVRRKHAAQGSAMEAEAARECSAILLEEHYAYVQTMRAELLDAKPASKHWWAKVRRIGNRKQQVSSIPALKDGANWILDAEAKANCFATTFESKNTMIDEEANEYTEILDSHPTFTADCQRSKQQSKP